MEVEDAVHYMLDVIDHKVNFRSDDVYETLTMIMRELSNDRAVMALLNRAAQVYYDHMVKLAKQVLYIQ